MKNTSDTQLLTQIAGVFEQVFGNQVAFTPDLDRANESRWTSLKHVEFLIALEVRFSIRFDGADATDMTSISAIAELVRRKSS